jgi:hypothetical protein
MFFVFFILRRSQYFTLHSVGGRMIGEGPNENNLVRIGRGIFVVLSRI